MTRYSIHIQAAVPDAAEAFDAANDALLRVLGPDLVTSTDGTGLGATAIIEAASATQAAVDAHRRFDDALRAAGLSASRVTSEVTDGALT